ncbi:MAG: hypothetical protein IPM29_09730 [Planctomycetes bacterium]|nr:hypothetical protein [Planctomycetota bacterium]
MRSFITPTFLALLAPLAVAQTTTVFPTEWTNTAGDTYSNRLPFSNGISRTQFLYESAFLPITTNHQITDVGFRQDNNTASTGKSIQLAIYMGSTTFTADTVTSNFANNYNGATARTLVFGPAIVALPSFQTQSNLAPVTIHLTTPYTFHRNENLLVEYVITANNNANLAFDYYLDQGGYLSTVTSFGTGCQSSAGQVPLLNGSPSYVNGSLAFSLSRAPGSSLVWLNMDFLSSPPIDATPFGAPGCTVYVPPRIAVASQGSPGGSAYWGFQIPLDRSLTGVSVFAQALIYDLFANNLGFVMSNGVRTDVGAYPWATSIFATGSATATTGSVYRNNVPISRFVWN